MLNDYECETCGKVFEIMSNNQQEPCTARACCGMATKKLGGRPAVKTNSGGFDCKISLTPVGERFESCGVVYQWFGINHTHEPKVKS